MITQTEIIARAIRQIDAECEKWRKDCEGLPENMYRQVTAELHSKREDLCTLYLIQTGTDYGC